MKYSIDGTTMQTLTIELGGGESVYTESGGMAWMSENIGMETNVKGGILSGLGRKLAGESLFMTTYTASSPGKITFTNEFPGKIIEVKLGEGETRICQKDAFMCAESSVKLEVHFRKKLGAGLFGGEGFILQKLIGPGTAFVEIAGEVVENVLEEGETLRIDPGHIAMYEPSVNYDISRVKGVKNMLFGGEGLFLATLKGPGKVWLQSMPIANLAGKLRRYLPSRR